MKDFSEVFFPSEKHKFYISLCFVRLSPAIRASSSIFPMLKVAEALKHCFGTGNRPGVVWYVDH